MALSFEISGNQIDGARDYQEDAFLITHLTDANGNPGALIVVADGMGGHAAGNVASNMAVQAFNKHISSHYPDPEIHEVLSAAVLKANHSIAETIKETPALEGMGCTIVAALLQNDQLWWASVGDSHIYLLRDRELTKINADHSYGGFLDALEAAGTPMEPEPGLSRNMLMSAITGDEIADIDCPPSPLKLLPGDKLLLCTDGMDTLSDGKLIQYSEWSDNAKECAESLLNAVDEIESPKQDNTTLVVVNVRDKESAAVEEASAPVEPAKEESSLLEQTSEMETAPEGSTEAGESSRSKDEVIEEIDLSSDVPMEEIVAEAEKDEEEERTEVVAPPKPEKRSEKKKRIRTRRGKGRLIAAGTLVLIIVVAAGYFFIADKDTLIKMVRTDKADGEITPELDETDDIAGDKVIEGEAVTGQETTETIAPAKPQTIVEFRDRLASGGTGPTMVWIPTGSFKMGSPGSSNRTEERPRHEVKLERFAISKYEITYAQYDRYAAATGKRRPSSRGLNRNTTPVTGITWKAAAGYAEWLSKQTGKKYRLPSESQWEYAASGGQVSPYWWGFNEKPGMAHCFACQSPFNLNQPASVGSFEPNQFGIYDTAGNVAEWVADCWHADYVGAPADGSVWTGGDCSRRIVRGGSFESPPLSIRRTSRDKLDARSGYEHVGFRVVRVK